MLSAQAKMTKERLFKALQITGAEDCRLIDFGGLTAKEWKTLQRQTSWSLEEDFLFWQSFCKEVSLQERLEILNLTTSNAAQLFGISENAVIKEIKEGAEPHIPRILQLARLEATFTKQLRCWLQCCAKLNQALIGIPCYDCPDDFYVCDQRCQPCRFPFYTTVLSIL